MLESRIENQSIKASKHQKYQKYQKYQNIKISKYQKTKTSKTSKNLSTYSLLFDRLQHDIPQIPSSELEPSLDVQRGTTKMGGRRRIKDNKREQMGVQEGKRDEQNILGICLVFNVERDVDLGGGVDATRIRHLGVPLLPWLHARCRMQVQCVLKNKSSSALLFYVPLPLSSSPPLCHSSLLRFSSYLSSPLPPSLSLFLP